MTTCLRHWENGDGDTMRCELPALHDGPHQAGQNVHVSAPVEVQPVCGRCGMPAHKVADATENGQPVEIWHHDSVADDVFCGLVMHAADRLPR